MKRNLRFSSYTLPILALAFAVAPVLGNNPLSRPGLLQTMGVAFVYGGLALTYDLLFGFTGLLSFGHALFFASGLYFTCILINHKTFVWWLAMIVSVILTSLLAALVGASSLRTTGITFAMVTLAFGEAGHVIVNRNFFNLTGGENGIALNSDRVPQFWIGVVNTKYLYWTALLVLSFVYFMIWWITRSSAGRVFAAIRDNELRVQVLGLNPKNYKLLSFTIAGALAGLLGTVMLLLAGSAAPRFASADLTISLLLMVILGGSVTRWGAVLGGVAYSYLTTRMQDLTQSGSLHHLPKWLSGPLSEPSFSLGIIFILVVMFAPGGLSGAFYHLRARVISKK